jgi:hypothetical protein
VLEDLEPAAAQLVQYFERTRARLETASGAGGKLGHSDRIPARRLPPAGQIHPKFLENTGYPGLETQFESRSRGSRKCIQSSGPGRSAGALQPENRRVDWHLTIFVDPQRSSARPVREAERPRPKTLAMALTYT